MVKKGTFSSNIWLLYVCLTCTTCKLTQMLPIFVENKLLPILVENSYAKTLGN